MLHASTPKERFPQPRQSIRNYFFKHCSPITKMNEEFDNKNDNEYYNENDDGSDESEINEQDLERVRCSSSKTSKEKETSQNEIPFKEETKKNQNMSWFGYIVMLTVIVVGLVFSHVYSNSACDETITLTTIKKQFPSQSELLWTAIASGLQEIKQFNRPIKLMLLYEEKSNITINRLLDEILVYLPYKLRGCNKKPIILTDEDMNSSQYINNYGIIIETYKDKLKQNGVMVIKNLENVSGNSALVLHSFCDEYTPLVSDAFIIFTVKMEKFQKNNMQFLEHYFRKKWSNIKEDIFYPLFTRISSMPLEITQESYLYL